MLAIVPAAGAAKRLQPLPFSKELLPVGSRMQNGTERPRAVSEFIVERLLIAGATRVCLVIAPRKLDIVTYYGANAGGVPICYVIQPQPAGLCDALFRALPFARQDELIAVGLPDTVWFPEDALKTLPQTELAFLLFPVNEPQHFDAVLMDPEGRVQEIQVKQPAPDSHWVWGAFHAPFAVMQQLHELWIERQQVDEYFGTLVNEYLRRGGTAVAVKSGTSYVDVGTVTGYRQAFAELAEESRHP